MKLPLNLTYENLTRQERLFIWMRRANLNISAIARACNVSVVTAKRWLNEAESIPSWRYHQLVELGIPAEILPPAKDFTPGPKPVEHPFGIVTAQ